MQRRNRARNGDPGPAVRSARRDRFPRVWEQYIGPASARRQRWGEKKPTAAKPSGVKLPDGRRIDLLVNGEKKKPDDEASVQRAMYDKAAAQLRREKKTPQQIEQILGPDRKCYPVNEYLTRYGKKKPTVDRRGAGLDPVVDYLERFPRRRRARSGTSTIRLAAESTSRSRPRPVSPR